MSPDRLKILVLSGNELNNDQLDFLQKCVSLIKLDLSSNNISKISDKINFSLLNRL